MNLTHFEPWSIVDLMNRDLDRINGQRGSKTATGRAAPDWVPAVDIIEENQRFVLRADIPGIRADDLDISMDAGVLSVSGQRQAETLGDDLDVPRTTPRTVHRTERRSGQFFRRFTLPETADAESITATSKDGILEIVIPKQAVVKPRRICVEAV